MKYKLLTVSLVLTLAMTAIGAASAATGSEIARLDLTTTPGATSTPCVTATGTPTYTPTAAATARATATSSKAASVPAARIAEAFCVTVSDVQEWHAQGLGYGEIGKAYALAKASGLTVEELFARHQAGEGWGEIARSLGFKVMGGGSNVRVVEWKRDGTPTPDALTASGSTHDNHGNGHGNGGGNGNGKGNGKGGKP